MKLLNKDQKKSRSQGGKLSEGKPSKPRASRDSHEEQTRDYRFYLVQAFKGLVVLVLFACLLLLLRPQQPLFKTELEIGKLSPDEIVAPFDIRALDAKGTAHREEANARAVLPLFEYDPGVNEKIALALDQLVAQAKVLRASEEITRQAMADSLKREFKLPLPLKDYEKIISHYSYVLLWGTIKTEIAQVLARKVVTGQREWQVISNYTDEGITQREVDDHEESQLIATGQIKDFRRAVEDLIDRLERAFPKNDDTEVRELAIKLSESLLRPNLVYLADETTRRRELVREQTEPIYFEVLKGRTLVGKGELVTPEIKILTDHYNVMRARSWLGLYLGLACLLLVPIFALSVFLRRYHISFYRNPRAIISFSVIIVLVLLMSRVASYLAAVEIYDIYLSNLGYVVPVAFVGVIVTILSSARMAVFVVTITAILSGMIQGWQFQYVLVGLWSGIIGAFNVAVVRKRSDLYKAGFWVSITAVLVILGIYLIQFPTPEELWSNRAVVAQSMFWGLLNGFLSVGMAMAVLPIFEDILEITTDIKLLELSMKNDLLRRLEEEAPGTYQHSLTVSALAESAAEAIGANALLARVGSYYHDIGKINKPMYFIENQVSAIDKMRHTRLTPNMSSLLIKNHVKDGLELAREYKLPKVIRAFISQHHGTTLLAYFYDQAMSGDDKDSVNEDTYRYSGPKPQTAETAIVLLADPLEAASRTLNSNSEGEIMQFVRKIINEKFIDRQLDECPLTLADLHEISVAFARTLISIMHRRVEYPNQQQARSDQREDKALT